MPNDKPAISVIIKTFNEQDGIAATIESIRNSLHAYPYEIIVADSLSQDKTQQIATDLGVKVVSLQNPDDRCCGVGHQLGYVHSNKDSKYLLLLDGDMELKQEFIDVAIPFLEENTDYAAVAGRVEMDEAQNHEFKIRKQRIHLIYPLGDVDHLGGGGLYRRSAIEEIGYLTNRNLHSFEEAELGLRLNQAGFKLHRLDVPYFFHHSYDMSTMQLLKNRWKSKSLMGWGELLRSAYGQPYFKGAFRNVKSASIFTLYLLGLFLSLLTLQPILIGLAVAPLCLFILLKALKNRSLAVGLTSAMSMTAFSAGLVRGLFASQKDPHQAPDSTVINEGE